MADEETKPARKARREVLYDKTKKPAPKVAAAESKPAAASGPSREYAEMLRRHENERRDVHGRHRAEHRGIDGDESPAALSKKVAAHRRQEQERAAMHERHEKELSERFSSKTED